MELQVNDVIHVHDDNNQLEFYEVGTGGFQELLLQEALLQLENGVSYRWYKC